MNDIGAGRTKEEDVVILAVHDRADGDQAIAAGLAGWIDEDIEAALAAHEMENLP
jgi:hypothetical protein